MRRRAGEGSGDDDAKQRFMQEARAASALDHANICSIFDIGEAPVAGSDGTQLFIVMAYYEGDTLKKRIQQGRMPVHEVISIAQQIAKGLAAASQRHGRPVTFGVLTTDTLEQAINRAGAKAGNKGAEAAMAAVEQARLYAAIAQL